MLVNADTREPDKLLNQRMAYLATSRARLDARVYTDSDEQLSAALARQVDKSTALEARRESSETKARSIARLVPVEALAPLQQFTQAEQPEASERLAAQRMPHLSQSGSAKLPAEPSALAIELQQMIEEINAQRAARKPLPVPDEPPARPYILSTPVDINRSAAELSAEIVQLANANRLERTGGGIAAPVQSLLERMLMKGAEQPPT